MKKITHQTSSFSLIEVIVFTSMLSIVLVAAVGYTVRLVFTMTHNRHKLVATHYVDEVKEWLNGERETDWDQFQGFASVGGQTYCVNNQLNLNSTLSTLSTGTCNFDGVVGNDPLIYQRQIIMTKNLAANPTRIIALIRVSWRDEGVLYVEQIETIYSVWE
ncbi:hypothetical protein COU87_04905 [Candidatus Roizmanbacteria bacterium CG10_big_fil_rev_8_21_14_0_10_39_12]|uniref:Type II secretion system protein n=1 Tax=Candidatus Roizmanbacteria bacterium CG10_big_fil_rev_8_21_14_0_10_39_12 TaxID=1974852 RepID=A0A2M8KN74_9BACT|nr:MAG: hypothetical protein COY15_02475 [Candidatus Roizmanbacteria bacterium CG_4_10_14_0_2_um_filter_39_12]PJE61365.1 MAG: hypothetical protein COU87_04905 [Candidatus Roizmanbacteria bacterium CG10_big_fil_rev_8_21_14_0_10_39_12]